MKAKLLQLISREVQGLCSPQLWKNLIGIFLYAAAIYLLSSWEVAQLMSE